MLHFLILTVCIIQYSNGQNVNSTESVSLCAAREGTDDLKCFMKLLALTSTSALTNWKNSTQVQEFKTTCDNMKACYESLECQKNDKNLLQARKTTKAHCDRMLEIPLAFPDCFDKLNSRNSPCWKNYIPIPGSSCQNIFGPNNCVRGEMRSACGKDQWVSFRESMIDHMETAHPECNFDKFRDV